MRQVGNLLHPSVVVHDNEDNNEIVRTSGDIEVGVTGFSNRYRRRNDFNPLILLSICTSIISYLIR